jgi:hypothetical protein
MRRTFRILFGLIVLLPLFAQAGVKFTYTWKSPTAQPVIFAGKKVAVLLMSKNRAPRRAAEAALAKEITKRGAEGIAASELITDTEMNDQEIMKTRFKEQNVAGVLAIRGTPKGDESYDPDMWKNPMYKDVWGFTSRSWSQDGTEPKQVRFIVEMAVYSLEQNQLIWLGTTEMKSKKLSEFIQTVVDEIAEEMQKEDLLAKKQ